MSNYFSDADLTVLLFESGALPKSFRFYNPVVAVSIAKEDIDSIEQSLEELYAEPTRDEEQIALFEQGYEILDSKYYELRSKLANKLNR